MAAAVGDAADEAGKAAEADQHLAEAEGAAAHEADALRDALAGQGEAEAAAAHEVDSLKDALVQMDLVLGDGVEMLEKTSEELDRLGEDATKAGALARQAFVAADDAADDAAEAFEVALRAAEDYEHGLTGLDAAQAAVAKAADLAAAALVKASGAFEVAKAAAEGLGEAERGAAEDAAVDAAAQDALAAASTKAAAAQFVLADAARALRIAQGAGSAEALAALASQEEWAGAVVKAEQSIVDAEVKAQAAGAVSRAMDDANAEGMERLATDAEYAKAMLAGLGDENQSAAAGLNEVGKAASTAGRFLWLTGNQWHWLIAGSAEFLAVAVPAMVAFGAAAADAAQGAQMVDEHMEALWTATEATGNMFHISAGQALGFTKSLQNAQDAANVQVYQALGGALDAVGGKFSSFAAGADQSLTKVKSGFGSLAATGNKVLNVMDTFVAHMQYDLVTGMGGEVNGLLSHMVPDLTQLGAVFGNLGHIVLNVAADMPGLAEVLLRVADGITTIVKWATQLGPAAHYLIMFGMAAEEAGRWGQVLVNILGKVGLATKVVEDTSSLGFFGKIGAGIQNLAATIGGILPKALGAAVSGVGMLIGQFHNLDPAIETAATKTMGLGSEITALANDPVSMAWIGVFVAGLVGVGVEMDKVRNSAQQFIDSINKTLASTTNMQALTVLANGMAGASAKISQQEQVLGKYPPTMQRFAAANAQGNQSLDKLIGPLAGVQQGASNVNDKINMFIGRAVAAIPIIGGLGKAYENMTGANQAANQIDQLTAAQKKWEQQATNVVQGAAAISKAYGTDFVGSLELAQQAGVQLTQGITGMSQAAVINRIKIADLVAGYQAMGQDNSAISGDMDDLAIQSGLAASKVQNLTQAMQQYDQNLTGGTSGLASFVTSMQNVGVVVGKTTNNLGEASSIALPKVSAFAKSLTSMGGQGAQAWTNFNQVVGSTAPQLIGWFQTAGAEGMLSGTKMHQGILDMLSALVPLANDSKTAQAEVMGLGRSAGLQISSWSNLKDQIKGAHASIGGLQAIVGGATEGMSNLGKVAQNLGDVMNTDIVDAMDKAKLAASGLQGAANAAANALQNPGTSAQVSAGKLHTFYEKVLEITGSKTAAQNATKAFADGYGQAGQAAYKAAQQIGQAAPKIPKAMTDAMNKGGPEAKAAGTKLASMANQGVSDEDLPGKMKTHGTQAAKGMHDGLTSQLTSIGHWGLSVYDKINNSLNTLTSKLFKIGKDAVEGLVNGLASDASGIIGAAAHLASLIPSTVSKLLHSASPSKVMMEQGEQAAQGLAIGITNGLPGVIEATHKLANVIPGGLAIGTNGIPLAWEAQKVGKDTISQLVKGLTGGIPQIKAAINDILNTLHKAIAAGMAKGDMSAAMARSDLMLSVTIEQDNKKLQALATQRNKIAKEIQAANAYAASVTSSMESEAGLGNLTQPTSASGATEPYTVASVQAQLTSQLKQMQAFDHNIDVLRKEGLSKQMIAQIVAMGYQQGGSLAQALAHGSASQIKDLNDTEKAIIAASKKIGKDSAESMYGSGKDAGKGFLAGLKSEEKAIDAEIKKIADDIVKAIRKALKSKSPSQVMHDEGMNAALGLANGLAAGTPMVLAAARKMAEAVSSVKISVPVASTHPMTPSASAGGGGAPMVVIHQHIAGTVVSEQQLQQHIQTQQLRYTRRNLGNGLFLQGRASGTPAR